MNPYELPGKSRPVRVKIVTSGCYIKLDLIEFIQVVDDIDIQMGFQEGTAFIIPLTVNDKPKSLTTHKQKWSSKNAAYYICVKMITIKIDDITCKHATLRQEVFFVCVYVSREVKAVGGREINVFKSQHFQVCYVKNSFAKTVKLMTTINFILMH